VLAGFTTRNASEDGIYLEGYPASSGVGNPVTQVLVYGVTSIGNGRHGMSPTVCDGLVVRDSTFSDQTGTAGIDIEPISSQAPNNYQIFNCVLSGNPGGGIQSGADDAGDDGTVTNMTYAFNTLSANGNYGIHAQNATGPFLILGNTISGSVVGDMYPGYGVMLRGESIGVSNATILDNSVTSCHSDGIFLNTVTASVCEDNTITGSGGEGINNQSGAGVTLAGNIESNNAGGN
jgi:hypothetical protein